MSNTNDEHAKHDTTGYTLERWPEGQSDEDRSYIRTWAQVPGVKSSLEKANEEHAQVGALLARCESFHVFRHTQTDEWISRVYIAGLHRIKTGPTQLAAIKAAVEAAEKGVRE